jgi:hypothetical protein
MLPSSTPSDGLPKYQIPGRALIFEPPVQFIEEAPPADIIYRAAME